MDQCAQELLELKLALSRGKGCNVMGRLMVNRVAGNFHFIPSRPVQSLNVPEVKEFNMSHTIHHLSFGFPYPGRVNPLDGIAHQVMRGVAQFQYFVKVVPTKYESTRKSQTVATNQYSVTEHIREAESSNLAPFQVGAYFVYDLSPIRVNISQKRQSFSSFIVGVCAIVGGVFTVAGLLDALVYHSINTWSKKVELGKTS